MPASTPVRPADIEGVLIHGAQGVRSLSVLLMAKGETTPSIELAETPSDVEDKLCLIAS